MEHVGDITKLDGHTLPPVDIITFGSPCQDLSMAGKRAGLQGERSSLFNEAIRIIYEMREATNGKHPTYAIWENVPGALSSTGGFDFATVLSAFTKTEIPIPDCEKWANAGMVELCRGNTQTTDISSGESESLSSGSSITLAWCVYNAQFFGVPQRRRRIFLIASFKGRCPGEILFKPKSLRRYLTTCQTTGQNTPTDVTRSTCDTITMRDTTGTLRANAGAPKHESDWESLVIEADTVHPQTAGTLCASGAGLNRPGGQGAETDLYVVEPTYCIHATSKGPGEYGIRGTGVKENVCHTLTGSDQHAVSAYAIQGMIIGRDENGPRGFGVSENTCYTLTATDKHATCYAESGFGGFRGGVGTLCASGGANGGGSENLVVPPPPPYVVRRLTPTECERLQGFPDGWTAYGNDGKEISDSKRYMMLGNSIAVPCVAYIMQGITEEIKGDCV
jgi:DNA (cytosine-5)-methyltransferase 1